MNRNILYACMLLCSELGANAQASDLPVALAVEAAQAAVEACKANGYNVTVTILDADLSIRLVLRGDGARNGTVQIAYRKAYTVIKTGMSSGDFGKTITTPPATSSGGSPDVPGPVNGDANLITWAGGLAIKAGGTVIGAISASGAPGGDKDEACVRAGLAKIAQKLQ
jgi:uncharacterized protein GlcG (DUF336 family)